MSTPTSPTTDRIICTYPPRIVAVNGRAIKSAELTVSLVECPPEHAEEYRRAKTELYRLWLQAWRASKAEPSQPSYGVSTETAQTS